jgi:ABC-type branched-subunit amino acid transport system ATPase component
MGVDEAETAGDRIKLLFSIDTILILSKTVDNINMKTRASAAHQSQQSALRGDDISWAPAHIRVAQGLGWALQEREVFRSLTVDENLSVAARKREWTVKAAFSLFPRLEERRKHLGAQLSGGEQ